ncbi:MAG: DUF3084 domain-containing protein [Candidatus Eremiobacteraeota bacterium]|nr:DUF3084 domain-containing protein [Candidatus Eremiobacteraeota bacterium]
MGRIGGIAAVIFIVLVAGLIAYLGDRVGHYVGRKRMTLFNLRPKYTSTIVAVATGMMIALVASIVILSTSPYARNAFFHLSEINNRVNALQAQADALVNRVRNTNVVLTRGEVVYNYFLIIKPTESPAQQLAALSAFFDASVAAMNRSYVPAGLRPFTGRASHPAIQKKLRSALDDETTQGFLLRGPVLVLALADENLFVNDALHFGIKTYADQQIFAAGQPITSVAVDGGTPIVPTVAYGQLAVAIREIAIERGMPPAFATVVPALSDAEVKTTRRTIINGHGHYYIIARARGNVLPQTTQIPVIFDLSRNPR